MKPRQRTYRTDNSWAGTKVEQRSAVREHSRWGSRPYRLTGAQLFWTLTWRQRLYSNDCLSDKCHIFATALMCESMEGEARSLLFFWRKAKPSLYWWQPFQASSRPNLNWSSDKLTNTDDDPLHAGPCPHVPAFIDATAARSFFASTVGNMTLERRSLSWTTSQASHRKASQSDFFSTYSPSTAASVNKLAGDDSRTEIQIAENRWLIADADSEMTTRRDKREGEPQKIILVTERRSQILQQIPVVARFEWFDDLILISQFCDWDDLTVK